MKSCITSQLEDYTAGRRRPTRINSLTLLAISCLILLVPLAEAQRSHISEQLDDLQRAVNAVRTAQKAGADSSALEEKLIRASREMKRFTSRAQNKSQEELYAGLAYVEALDTYFKAEKIRRYLRMPNVYLHNSTELSDIVDKYDLPTELVRGTGNRRVKSEALPKMWRIASGKLDEANKLLLKYKGRSANEPE